MSSVNHPVPPIRGLSSAAALRRRRRSTAASSATNSSRDLMVAADTDTTDLYVNVRDLAKLMQPSTTKCTVCYQFFDRREDTVVSVTVEQKGRTALDAKFHFTCLPDLWRPILMHQDRKRYEICRGTEKTADVPTKIRRAVGGSSRQ